MAEIEFVEELPSIQRKVDSGVWGERLGPLRDHPGVWAKVYGPTDSPHTTIGYLTNGSASGVDPTEFEFAGRTVPVLDEEGRPTTEEVEVKDDDGNVTGTETQEVREGYVYAQFLTEEGKAEKAERLAEKRAAREARKAGIAEADQAEVTESEDEYATA